MKKSLISIALVMLVSVCLIGFTGCAAKLSADEQLVVGNYKLSAISIVEYPTITVSTYEYFTLEFKSDRTCVIKSKAGTVVYEATASWKINNDGEIEVVTKQGNATATEKYRLDGDVISGTNSELVNGSMVTMTVSFQRVVEE